jgi:hypothetical protein
MNANIWEGLWQAGAALFGALFTAAGCYAAGVLLTARLGLRDKWLRAEQAPLAFVTGAAAIHLAVFAIFAFQIAYWPVLVALLAAAIAGAIWTGEWRLVTNAAPPLSAALQALLGVCGAAFFVLYLVNAWAPEASPDGSSYHLGLVARYLRAHGFERITTNWYAAFGGGMEMLYAPAFAIGGHSAAALVHFCFAIAMALAMLAYGRRMGKPWAGGAGALLAFLSPVVGKDGTSAYVDVGVAAIVFGAFYWLEIWDASRDWRVLIPVGLLAGYAYAAKYTAFVIAIYALGFVALRARRLKPVMLVAACAAVMAGPWAIRNALWYQNPIAPMGNAIFPNPHFYILAERDWAAWLRHYDVQDRRELPLEVTVRGVTTNGLLGPVFLLAPAALVALRYPHGRRLLAAGAMLLATYPANVGTRFLIPCLPFFSLALALAAGERRLLLAGAMLAHAVSAWPTVVRSYAPGAWRIEHFPLRAALRLEPADAYLRRVSSTYAITRMVENHVPAGEPVLAMSGLADAYTTREILVSFQAASNQALTDAVQMGWDLGGQPLRAWTFRLEEVRVRRIRLVQTEQAQYPEQWNVHELRFFHGGRELARNARWRITARPNPWDVRFAFDNSPVTRWRSWEVARPGMYIEADFGEEEFVDQVRFDTSPDYVRARFQVEAGQAGGGWRVIAQNPEESVFGGPRRIRPEAIREMSRRGVRYLLVRDTDYGAADYSDDPEGWGLDVAAKSHGATLYRSMW